MHISYMARHFASPVAAPATVRSSEAFVAMAEQGLACCLIPELQIRQQLEEGACSISARIITWSSSLYWHRWVLSGAAQADIPAPDPAGRRVPATP